MKIEIGESLASSYLRHVKLCWLVQTNWKTSEHWSMKLPVEARNVEVVGQAASTSVLAKSSPLNSSGAFRWRASA